MLWFLKGFPQYLTGTIQYYATLEHIMFPLISKLYTILNIYTPAKMHSSKHLDEM